MNKTVLGLIIAVIAILGIGGLLMANKSDKKVDDTAQTTTAEDMPAEHGDEPEAIEEPADGGEGNATATDKAEIKDFAFTPQDITVKKGTTVTWTNSDSVAHTVTSDNGVFDSGNMSQGESFSFTFDETGTFDYHCTPHPQMTGTVTVTE